MVTTAADALDELALLYVRSLDDPDVRFRMRLVQRIGLEPVIGELTSLSVRSLYAIGQRADYLGTSLLSDDRLASLRPVAGQLDPFIGHEGGGHRMQPGLLAAELLGGAVARCMILGLAVDESTIRAALSKAFDHLATGLNGDAVPFYKIYGLTGVDLRRGAQLRTPWGTLRKAPEVDMERWVGHQGPWATATFETTQASDVSISREPEPGHTGAVTDHQQFAYLQKGARELFPLACTLGSADDDLAAPTLMWETGLVTFSSPHGYGSQLAIMAPQRCPDITDRIPTIEEWSKTVSLEHHANVDIAAHRVVSATARRQDRTDSLIDAVTAWENLVGAESETTFRVTASLARLLEPRPELRLAYRKKLSRIYDLRSRVVHGEAVKAEKVAASADEAVKVAVQALRASYLRGQAWLVKTSRERSDQLLVSEVD